MPLDVPKTDDVERFFALRREVNRLLRRIFEEGTGTRNEDGVGPQARADVSEASGALTIQVETPGISANDLSLWVSRDLVIVEGDKPRSARPSGARVLSLERDWGRFRRVLEIPCAVDTTGVRAAYARGVLTVTLPKIEKDRRGERVKVPIRKPAAGGKRERADGTAA